VDDGSVLGSSHYERGISRQSLTKMDDRRQITTKKYGMKEVCLDIHTDKNKQEKAFSIR